MRTTDRRILLVAAAAALIFNNWLLGFVFERNLLIRGGSVSELSAAGQPHRILFRSLDVVAGAVIMLLAYLLYRAAASPGEKMTTVVLAILGVANIADACLPLPCSGTLDASCVTPISLSLHNWVVPAHAYSSTIIGICFFLLPFTILRWQRNRLSARLVVWNILTLAVTLIFFGFLLAQVALNTYSGSSAAGYSQEAQMAVFGIWTILMSGSVAKAPA